MSLIFNFVLFTIKLLLSVVYIAFSQFLSLSRHSFSELSGPNCAKTQVSKEVIL